MRQCGLLPLWYLLTAVSGSQLYESDPDEKDCPEKIIPELFLYPYKIMPGTPNRAIRTVPEGFVEIRASPIPGARLGAFTCTFLPRYTWLAEFEGEVVALDAIDDVEYAWNVYRAGELCHYVDADNDSLSNWLRYINCPRHKSEANVAVATCHGRLYYYTTRDVAPATELLIYYGDNYAKNLGIDTWEYWADICPHFQRPAPSRITSRVTSPVR